MARGSAAFWAILFFGVIDLAVPVGKTPGFFDAYLLETGWGVLFTFLVAAPFLSLVVRPAMAMPVVQVVRRHPPRISRRRRALCTAFPSPSLLKYA